LSDRKRTDHPDLFELAALAEGSLGEEKAAVVGRHVVDCALCSLEMKRLERFESIDEDEDLITAASWDRAEAVLEAARRTPNLSGQYDVTDGNKKNHSWQWMVPVAAAAVLLVLFMPDLLESPARYSEQKSPLRGGEEIIEGITPVAPVGDLPGPPKYFTWNPDKPFEFYTLRIFTPELETVFEESGITSRKRVVADSLLASLRPGIIYLWTVTGHTGLEQAAASPSARFMIVENPPQK
jgi:hypothetical protein